MIKVSKAKLSESDILSLGRALKDVPTTRSTDVKICWPFIIRTPSEL